MSRTKWLAAVGGCLALLGACSDDEPDEATTTTEATEEPTTTVGEPGTDEQALIAAEAASPGAMENLSDEEFLGGVRVACETLAEPDADPAALLASLRTVLGISPQDDASFAEVTVALVAGAEVLCPTEGAALAEAAGV